MTATAARIAATALAGVHVVTPAKLRDERGEFYESVRTGDLATVTGEPFIPCQVNFSVSHRNTLRGIHTVTVPPGQAKYVTCVRGAVRDVVVDLRMGSPTFGQHHVTLLDPESARAVYVPEGVGHGFLTLADDTCICYLLSSVHVPGTQVDLDPWDPDLAVPWGCREPPLMSEKDVRAPRVADAITAGLLPRWTEKRP